MALFTKQGRPLQVHGNIIYSRSGIVIGQMNGNKVFGTDGHYVGTIDGDRLVYRSTDRAVRGGAFSAAKIAGSGMGKAAGAAIYGDEPDVPD